MYLENNLVKKNGIEIDGIKIDLTNIDIPAYFLSAKDDHIAPWHCTFKANKILKDNTRFVLSESGHIAGVVNNLTKNKYCHWTNDDVTVSADKWFENATRHEESWRSDWLKWHSKLSGEKIELANNSKEIEPAPGRYVKIIAK
jgi:polyhydroxyalkanoate synthase